MLAVPFDQAPAAEAKVAKKEARKESSKKHEVLACKNGTEKRHARVALELLGGKVSTIAYYSIWKPRTCSVHIMRGDAYSKWQDVGNATTITLSEDNGTVMVRNEAPGKY